NGPGNTHSSGVRVRAGCAPAGEAAPVVSPATWRPIAQALAAALAGVTDPQAVELAKDLARAGFAPGKETDASAAGTAVAAGGNVAELCGLIVAVVPLSSVRQVIGGGR
ncbi:MAG: hypothetical protein L0H84_04090, partial [Pseudonocardia sp.]|nr:hypothetical protein [Pseudonocardia sp.]